jgi:hypothetical protein
VALPGLRKIVRGDARHTLGRLKTDVGTIVRAVRVVLHRGSRRAAEEQTGHNDETLAAWIKRVGDRAEATTDFLARALRLAAVERAEPTGSV